MKTEGFLRAGIYLPSVNDHKILPAPQQYGFLHISQQCIGNSWMCPPLLLRKTVVSKVPMLNQGTQITSPHLLQCCAVLRSCSPHHLFPLTQLQFCIIFPQSNLLSSSYLIAVYLLTWSQMGIRTKDCPSYRMLDQTLIISLLSVKYLRQIISLLQ